MKKWIYQMKKWGSAIVLTSLLITIVISSASSELAKSPWPKFQRDIQNTGQSTYVGAKDNELRWSYQIGGFETSVPWSDFSITTPLVIGENNTAFFGTFEGSVYSVNLFDNLNWEFKTPVSAIYSTPAIGRDNTIYFGSTNGNFYALREDGSLKWQFETQGWVFSPPTIAADGTIYFGSGDNHLYALNPDGSERWSYEVKGEIYSSPAIGSDGTIYFGSTDNKFYALYDNGGLKWSYSTGGAICPSPAIAADGTIYFGSVDNHLYALNPDGSERWSFGTGGGAGFPAISRGGTIYFRSKNMLHALDSSGNLKWSFESKLAMFHSSIAIGRGDTIYFTSGDNLLYAVDKDGKLKWSFDLGFYLSASPVIGDDGTIYVGTQSGKLYAIGSPVEQPQTQPKGEGNDNALLIAGILSVIIVLVGIVLWLKRR